MRLNILINRLVWFAHCPVFTLDENKSKFKCVYVYGKIAIGMDI